jgi:1,4-dihydroxy-2-naphthoate octaprenyltransferase
MKSFRLFIQLSRPMNILSAVLLYLLGIGIAHYLNGQINWTSLFLGLAWIVIILLGTQYLNEYFDPLSIVENPIRKHTPFSGVVGAIGSGRLPRQVALWAGLTCYAITASLTILIIQSFGTSPVVLLIFGLILLAGLLYALPPSRLISSGYGELILSIIITGLIPASAFLLQGHVFHRLLIMVAFPLTTLHIGMLLALEFPDYASDLLQDKRSILVRVGWQRGMIMHNVLVLGSFVILGMAFVFGLPLRVGWPVFFVLPIGLFQVWIMNRIADGAKPNWNLLMLVATSTFGLAAYLLTFAFWTH